MTGFFLSYLKRYDYETPNYSSPDLGLSDNPELKKNLYGVIVQLFHTGMFVVVTRFGAFCYLLPGYSLRCF